jgi:iron only hydrogenase large subunit-like protein
MIKLSGLDLEQLEPELPDAPFYSTASAGKLSAVAGGEAEATVRTIYARLNGSDLSPSRLHRFRINKSYREMTVKEGREEIRFGTVSGLAKTAALIEDIKAGKRTLDLLEIMACPEGCINGGGQPVSAEKNCLRTRTKAVYDLDNGSEVHTAHSCELVQEAYREILEEPGGQHSRELFYTTYSTRDYLM